MPLDTTPTMMRQQDTIWPLWTANSGTILTTTLTAQNKVTVWPMWNQNTVNVVATETWPAWNQYYTTGTITAGYGVWTQWNEQAQQWQAGQPIQYPALTEEQRAERQRQAEIAARRRRLDQLAQEKDRRVAARRARSLLRSALSREQKKQYDEAGHFDLILPNGNRYRIHRGTHGNVRLLDAEGREYKAFCIQPSNVPDEDAMLAQMLALQTDEARFRQVANERRLVDGYYRDGLYGERIA